MNPADITTSGLTDNDIKKLILKSHLRGEKKVIHWVKKQIANEVGNTTGVANISEERIKHILENIIPKDRYWLTSSEPRKHYYYSIFTPFIGGFQIDLIVASKKENHPDYPPYYFVAINVNTKYGYAYPMQHKNEAEILRVLNIWEDDVKKVGPGKLAFISADEEPGWNTDGVEQWLKDRKIQSKLIPSDRHSALGVVDRFVRTLRDMNIRTEKGKKETNDRKYRDFTPKRMNKILDIYNHSIHSTIQMTPLEMENDTEKQKEYIIKKVYEAEGREKITDLNLKVGSWVRFMIPREFSKKRRYQVSPDIVQIARKEGHAYVLMAKDGSTATMARWRLFPVKDKDGYRVLTKFHQNTGIIKRVIGGTNRKGEYHVEWEGIDGEVGDITWEPPRNIRIQENGQRLIDEYVENRNHKRKRKK
jgi:hypothetical protein